MLSNINNYFIFSEANKAKCAYQDSVNSLNSIESELKETKDKLDLIHSWTQKLIMNFQMI